MALWSQQGGDMQAAAQWRARLAKAAPDSPGLQDLDNAKRCRRCRRASSTARQQARGGNIPGRWRPAQYVQWQYAACRAGGGILPDHGQRQIALSAGYQRAAPVRGAASAGERPAGGVGQSVNGGKRLAGKGSPCSSRWPAAKRRTAACAALLWLGPQAGDEQYYDTDAAASPDSEVQNYFRERRSGQARGQATPISTAAIPPPRNSSLKRYCRPTP